MLRVGNFFVSVSIEGFEQANDGRRGEGHFEKALAAMDLMHKNRIPFGVSICYTSKNYKDVTSDAFFDLIISKGCYFPWYFDYMPVGMVALDRPRSARERGAPVRQMQGLRRPLASRGRKSLGRGALRVNDFSVTFPDTQESRRPSGRRLLPHFRILYLTAASRASTRSVFSQATPRSSRPMWP